MLSLSNLQRLLENIQLALSALAPGVFPEDRKWDSGKCTCDTSVGQTPCEYCATYNALTRSEALVKYLINSQEPELHAIELECKARIRRLLNTLVDRLRPDYRYADLVELIKAEESDGMV